MAGNKKSEEDDVKEGDGGIHSKKNDEWELNLSNEESKKLEEDVINDNEFKKKEKEEVERLNENEEINSKESKEIIGKEELKNNEDSLEQEEGRGGVDKEAKNENTEKFKNVNGPVIRDMELEDPPTINNPDEDDDIPIEEPDEDIQENKTFNQKHPENSNYHDKIEKEKK